MKKKVFIHTLYFAAIGIIFGGMLAIAGNVSIPFTFSSDTTASSSEVNANFQTLADAINNCPAGMVKVGSVCIDIYEASVWDAPDDTSTTQYGATADDYPCGDNGNDCSSGAANPVYAQSIAGVTPARYITWFQAQQACANSGKRLITNAEWQMAAAGTDDSGTNESDAACNIFDTSVDNAGANADCTSSWGTYDMVGNVWEWTADWMQGHSGNGASGAWDPHADSISGVAYGDDYIYGINEASPYLDAMPAALFRGGGWSSGVGFRCAQ